MNNMKPIWKIFSVWLLMLLLILASNNVFGQKLCKQDICVIEFNAGWNEGNSVEWLEELKDCGVSKISIDDGEWQKKYSIVVVPTIIVFNGKEVERFQADLTFAIQAKREDIQDVVDEILMEDF